MTAAFLFYLSRAAKNRFYARLKRLRQPKYLIAALGGLAYLYVVFLHQVLFRWGTRRRAPAPLNLDVLPLMEVGFALLLFGIVIFPWLFASKGSGITFTEAEVQFLFPAPVSRRTLLHLRMAKSQLGIAFGVLVSYFMFGQRGTFLHPAYFIINLWLVYSFLALYRMGASLALTSLSEHGVSGFKRQASTLAVIALTVVLVVAWLKWFIPALPELKDVAPEAILDWVHKVSESGPAFYFLLPFRVLVRPALAQDLQSFALRLIPATAIFGLAYLWVVRSDVNFQEASLEKAEKVAQMREAKKKGLPFGPSTGGKRRRPWFRLAPQGFAAIAILWKNLISSGRLAPSRVLVLVIVLFIVITVASARADAREIIPMIVGSVASGMVVFVTVLGPVVVRDDLRKDLLNLDLIKSYPVSGWTVVLGEVLAPAVILALMEWTLILFAVCYFPSMGKFQFTLYHRIVFGLGAAIVFPGLSLLGVLVQNAVTLLMPGWVHLGKDTPQGVEAMGQQLITMLATVLVLLFAVIPGAILFALAFLSGYWLIGLAVVPLAALVACLGILLEAGLAIAWLGRLFDKFDVSLELDTTGN